MKEKIKISLPAAIGIAVLPPIWAVLSSLCGIEFGWIALACAGIYVATGDNVKNGLPMSFSFLMGAIWGYMATKLLEIRGINHYILLFLILCIMGFLCVILAFTILEKVVFLPAWLGSWAIALGTFGQAGGDNLDTIFVKLLITMLVGVWYVGAFNSYFQNFIRKKMNKLE